jgi:hypothetical protein
LESGEKKKFCSKLPFQNIYGYDIYGNPFPNPGATGGSKKAKKEKTIEHAALDMQSNGDSPGTPLMNGSGGADVPVKVGKNSGIVYFPCTSCDNEKVVSSRYAAHLDKCLGISGRKSSRAAMVKMNNNGSNNGSPMHSIDQATTKSASRKPSPDKPGKDLTPMSVEDNRSGSAGLSSGTSALPTNISISKLSSASPKISYSTLLGSNTAVSQLPKKKKKPVPSPLPSVSVVTEKREEANNIKQEYPAKEPGSATLSAPVLLSAAKEKDPNAPPKKRKRKVDHLMDDLVSENGTTPVSKPKKQRTALPDITDIHKKNPITKFKTKSGSPVPSLGKKLAEDRVRISIPSSCKYFGYFNVLLTCFRSLLVYQIPQSHYPPPQSNQANPQRLTYPLRSQRTQYPILLSFPRHPPKSLQNPNFQNQRLAGKQ